MIIKIHPRVLCVGVKNQKPRFLTAWLTGSSYGCVRYRLRKPLWYWTYWKQFEVDWITEFWENGRPRFAKKSDKKNSRDFLKIWKNFFSGFSVSRARNLPTSSLSLNLSTPSSLRSTRHHRTLTYLILLSDRRFVMTRTDETEIISESHVILKSKDLFLKNGQN